MTKFIFVLLVFSLVIGCANTRVFMGSYDSVKINISNNQAKMVAENKTPDSNTQDEIKKDFSEESKKNGKVHVYIIYSDKNLDAFRNVVIPVKKNWFTIEKRIRTSHKNAIAEVTIYPKRRDSTDPSNYYHLIVFKTMNGLSKGTHRLFVKDRITFTFVTESISDDIHEITMYISHLNKIPCDKFTMKDNGTNIPINFELQILSEIISIAKKPIKIIFTVT